MKLNFLGNGSGFAPTHTGAYFVDGEDLIVIDCSMLNLQKILALNPNNFKNIYLVITHMHDDHVSGMGLFIQYIYYVYKSKLNIIIPNELEDDILSEFKIKGISQDIYNLMLVDDSPSWLVGVLPTTHAPELDGKCFGYLFKVDGVDVIYSGDTNILSPYEKFLTPDSEFYVDVSANYGGVHLKYDDVKDKLLKYANDGVDIYIMHIDNEKDIREKIEGSKINIAECNI